MTERRISATEARVHFGELLDSVTQNLDIVWVERSGVPQAVVVPVQEWLRRTGGEDPWAEFKRLIAEHDEYTAEAVRAGRVAANIDVGELIRAGREERDEQLLGPLLGREPGGAPGPAADSP